MFNGQCSMKKTDLIIIGAGPGGYRAAEYAAKQGLKVVIFEGSDVGGTCLNVGCIPTKTYVHSATFEEARERMAEVVTQLRAGVEGILSHPNITLVREKASFENHGDCPRDSSVAEIMGAVPVILTASGETYTAPDIIIATGSETNWLPIPGKDDPRVVDSTGLLQLDTLPKRLCIIGAGVIGMEFASVFNRFGSEVTVIEYLKECLPALDSDIAKRLRKQMERQGVTFHMQCAVKQIADGSGSFETKKGETKTPKPSSGKTGPKPFTESRRLYYGATYLLESFSDQIGLTNDLKQCFPDIYKKLLSIAFFLILEDNNPLYRFEKWNLTHKHPYEQDIASPRSSELFASITDDQVTKFLRLQAKRRVEDDKLPQINLLLVFGETSGLPFYYRKLAGNIPDSKTVKHLLEDLDILGFGKTKFVMDRGFYSEDNINGLYREHVKFLVGVRLSLKFIKKNLDEVYDDIRMFTNYDESINTYGYTVSAEWDYSHERPYKGDVIKDKRRIYIHYYYSIEKKC